MRPSIITGCKDEPMPGWTDTLAAAGGLAITMGLGIIHYVLSDPEVVFDIIPGDYVSNLIIATAFFRAHS